jgi:hypothetical protein
MSNGGLFGTGANQGTNVAVMGGILGEMLKQMNIPNISSKPVIEGGILKIEINENEVREIALRGVNENVKQYIEIKLHEGKMELRVRLY